jgi:hypothetical protein
MSTWKKIVIVNGGGLSGIVISLFIVPAGTPLWLWAAISGIVLALLNYLFLRAKGRNPMKPKTTVSTAIVLIGVGVLLLDLIWRYLHR